MSMFVWGMPETNHAGIVREQMWPLIAGVEDYAVAVHESVSGPVEFDAIVWSALFDVAQWCADRHAL